MSVALLDPGTGNLRYATAGHLPALIRSSADGKITRADKLGGPVLGVFDDASFMQHDVVLQPQDILLLYSDGLIERRTEDIDTGLGRLAGQVERWPAGRSLAQLCQHLAQTCPGQPQYDDICALAVRRRPAEAA